LFSLVLAFSIGCTASPPKPSEPELLGVAMATKPGAQMSEGLLSAEFLPQYDLVFAPAGLSFGSQQLNVLIRLSAADHERATARADLDLAIVLDQSGSMGGDKLRYAKQAGLDLLAQLEPRDRVTLITYADFVATRVLARGADLGGVLELRAALLEVSPGGGTALGPGLFEGLRTLEQQDHDGRLAHVLLLSDGHANPGERRPTVIAERVAQGYGRGVTVSTLGMGAGYNEELMALVADEGGGRYHFIEDAQQIPSVLANEFAGLTSSVAADLAVEFVANAPTSVAAVHGYVSETEARHTTIRIGYLGSGQSREIVAQLDIPNAMLRGQPGEMIELGVITVRFRPVDSASGADAAISEIRLPAKVTVAGSAEQVRGSERTEVTVRVAEIEAATSLHAASQALNRDDFAAAERIFNEADVRLGDHLENARSDAERQKLQAQVDALASAHSSLAEAKQSAGQRPLAKKRIHAEAIKLGKGDSALD
jgi:Ca-activated chloride channel family protein